MKPIWANVISGNAYAFPAGTDDAEFAYEGGQQRTEARTIIQRCPFMGRFTQCTPDGWSGTVAPTDGELWTPLFLVLAFTLECKTVPHICIKKSKKNAWNTKRDIKAFLEMYQNRGRMPHWWRYIAARKNLRQYAVRVRAYVCAWLCVRDSVSVIVHAWLCLRECERVYRALNDTR